MDRRRIAYIGLAATAAVALAAGGALAQARKPAPAKPAARPAAVQPPAVVQKVTGPRTQYWIDASTEAGISLGGAGAKPGLGSVMSMMRSMGANSGHHKLWLRLGSVDGPGLGATTGTHMTPPGLASENPLKLAYTPPKQSTPGEDTPERSDPPKIERPKGRILLYAGCGPHAPANQPIVIDLSKITDPETIRSLTTALQPITGLQAVNPPTPGNSKSFAEGPVENPRKAITLPLTGSLLGDHVVKSNAAPDINFTLQPGQDFLPPFNVTSTATAPDGSIPLIWDLSLNVKAIGVTAMGGRQDGSIVMWANSLKALSWAGAPSGFLTARDIDRVVGDGTLLRGSTTTCTIPAEVFAGGGGGLYNIYGYAPDTDIAFPARPADPKVTWDIQWTTKVRYRTQISGILGMGAMMGAAGGQGAAGAPGAPPAGRPSVGGLLGRAIIGGALGK